MIYSWQDEAWNSLADRRPRLPHALLLSGRNGIGKSRLAQSFAQALLCQVAGDTGRACELCQACGWFALGNHPDFRLIQPDSMAPETEEESKKDKKKSDQIRIEQIRGLESFLAVGTHRGGLRIIVVDPADDMNTVTQNALLKSLEEPPASTLFILVSSRPQRLLATIRSRCQLVSVPVPRTDTAIAWLAEQGMAQPEAALAVAGGAPLAALDAAQWQDSHAAFLSNLREPRFDPMLLADVCSTLEPLLVVGWMQRWVHDLLQVQAAGTLRYHRHLQEHMQHIASRADPIRLSALLRQLAQARALATHPLNPRLFFENLFLEYRAVMGS